MKPPAIFTRIRDNVAAKFGKPSASEAKPAPASISAKIDELRFHADAAFGPGWTDANLGSPTLSNYNDLSKKIAAKLADVDGYAATGLVSKNVRAGTLSYDHEAHTDQGNKALKLLAYKIENGEVHPKFAAEIQAMQKRVECARRFCAEVGVDFDAVMASDDVNSLRDALQARVSKEQAAEVARLEQRSTELRCQIAAVKAEIAEHRAVIAKATSVRKQIAAYEAVMPRFLGVSVEVLHSLVKDPKAFGAKFDERVKMKAKEKLLSLGHSDPSEQWLKTRWPNGVPDKFPDE